MPVTLWIECSPNGENAASRIVGRMAVDALFQREPASELIHRPLYETPAPLVDPGFTRNMFTDVSKDGIPAPLEISEMLIRELEAADSLVISTPMHNFTVPAALKAWIDQVARINRAFRSTPTGKIGLLADRPTYITVSSGGYVLPPNATQPDFLTPYLTAILNTIGIHALSFFYLENTKTLTGPNDERLEKIKRRIEATV